ncbi:MAG TPA: hypothetical protein PLF31_03035 [Candidatus Paceibacterota bacterium]|nr:hypothetical protein [Candidatus Paceibacterota bacterium]
MDLLQKQITAQYLFKNGWFEYREEGGRWFEVVFAAKALQIDRQEAAALIVAARPFHEREVWVTSIPKLSDLREKELMYEYAKVCCRQIRIEDFTETDPDDELRVPRSSTIGEIIRCWVKNVHPDNNAQRAHVAEFFTELLEDVLRDELVDIKTEYAKDVNYSNAVVVVEEAEGDSQMDFFEDK